MSKRRQDEMKKRLLEERDSLLRQRDAIENQITGIERAIALIGEDAPTEAKPGGKRGPSNKAILLDLLKEAGTTGLNAASAVAMADTRGITLEKNSVSSVLSRLKKDDVVVYDGERYRLKEFVPTRPASGSDDQFGSSSYPEGVEPLNRANRF